METKKESLPRSCLPTATSIVNGNFGTFPLEKGRPSDESAT
jgi:hypothetical protein